MQKQRPGPAPNHAITRHQAKSSATHPHSDTQSAPTKWSNYSLINPPGAHVGPEEAPGSNSKITGARHSYLAAFRPPGAPAAAGTDAAAAATATAAADAATHAVLHVPEGKTRRQAHVDKMRNGPLGTYAYPPTSSMEFGWVWRRADGAAGSAVANVQGQLSRRG